MNLQAISSTLPASAGAAAPTAASATPRPASDAAALAASQAQSEKKPVDSAQLQAAISATNDFVKPINSSIEFSMDKDAGAIVVKVMDNTTNEVIRQIPSEEMLELAKALDKFQGLLIKQKA